MSNTSKMEEKILFWQTRVHIAQAPVPFDPLFVPESNSLPFEESPQIRSFLDDPLGGNPLVTYGLEITYKKNLEVVFFTKAQSKGDAIKIGYTWLSNLRYKFTGLDGVVKVKAITQKDIDEWNKSKKVEIKLPSPIIRNKIKILASINNAQKFLDIQQEFGSFNQYIWSFVNYKPIINAWEKDSDIPCNTELSDTISRDLKKRGFKFVGSTTIYAHLQAAGLVNDHLISCFRYNQLK